MLLSDRHAWEYALNHAHPMRARLFSGYVEIRLNWARQSLLKPTERYVHQHSGEGEIEVFLE